MANMLRICLLHHNEQTSSCALKASFRKNYARNGLTPGFIIVSIDPFLLTPSMIKSHSSSPLVTLGALLLVLSPWVQVQANLVVNGGFEDGAQELPPGSNFWSGNMNGWTGSGATATSFYYNNFPGPYDYINNGPHSGNLVAAFSQLAPGASISQDIATVAGFTYRVSFWLSNQISTGTPNLMSASFGGTALTGGSPSIPGELPAPMPWTQYSFDVAATSSLTALTFSGGGNGATAVLLDDVTIDVVPEPAVYGILMAAALLGIGGVKRMRRRPALAA